MKKKAAKKLPEIDDINFDEWDEDAALAEAEAFFDSLTEEDFAALAEIDDEEDEDKPFDEEREQAALNELQKLPDKAKYKETVFRAGGVFFMISEGSIRLAHDVSNTILTPALFKGILTGPTAEEEAGIKDMMHRIGFNQDFFNDALDVIDEFSAEAAESYFNEDELADPVGAQIYNEMVQEVKSGKTPFKSMEHFFFTLARLGIGNKELCFVWDGDFYSLRNYIRKVGSSPGYIPDILAEDWPIIFSQLDSLIVTPDPRTW